MSSTKYTRYQAYRSHGPSGIIFYLKYHYGPVPEIETTEKSNIFGGKWYE